MLFTKKKKFYTLSDIRKQIVFTPLIFVLISSIISILVIIFTLEFKKNNEIKLLLQKNKYEKTTILEDYVSDIKYNASGAFDEQESVLNKAVTEINGYVKYSSGKIGLDELIDFVKESEKRTDLHFVIFDKKDYKILYGENTVKYLTVITDSKELNWDYFKYHMLKNIEYIGDSNLIYWIDKEKRKIQLSFFRDIENSQWFLGAFSRVDDMKDATRVAILNTIIQKSKANEDSHFWFYDYGYGYVYNYYNKGAKIDARHILIDDKMNVSNTILKEFDTSNIITASDNIHNFSKYSFLISLKSSKISKQVESIKYEYRKTLTISITTVLLIALFLISASMVFSKFINKIFNRYNKRIETKNALYKKWKDRYELAIIASNDGLWDIDLKTNNIFFSKKWLAMFGYDSSEIKTLDEWRALIHKDDKENTFKKFQEHLQGKTNHFICEYRIKDKKGNYKWILVRGKAFKDENQKPKRMLMMSMDIEERKKLTKELEYVDLLVEYGRIVIFKWKNNKNFDIEYVSKSIDAYGYEVQDFEEGKIQYFEFMHENDVNIFKEDIKDAILNDKKSFSKVYRVKDKDGENRWVFFRTIFLKDHFGNVTHLYGYINDITRMKLHEEELTLKVQTEVEKNIEKDRMLVHQSKLAAMGEMLGNIAHQWRQPLNNINLLTHFVRDNYGNFSKEELDDIIKDVKVQIDYMSQTIDDFRNFYQPAKDKIHFDVKEAIISSTAIVETQFEKYGIKLDVSGDSAQIYNYKNEFQQVVLNILNNASDAALIKKEISNFKAEVNISVKKIEDKVEIKLSNNCGNVTPEVMTRMFEPYFTTKFENQGTGIGLYMAKTIIEKNMFGSIIVENIEDGVSFNIILPIFNN